MKALAICFDRFWTNPIGSALVSLCRKYDIELHKPSLREYGKAEDHSSLMEDFDNIITWGCYHEPSQEMLADRNVVYLENDMFGDKSFFYINSAGWHKRSTLSSHLLSREEPTAYQRDEVMTYVEKLFDHEAYCGYKKDGHYLVALQSHWDWDSQLLEKVQKYLPNKPICVRFHPHQNKEAYEKTMAFCEAQGWKIDKNDLGESLAESRAVITNFSSVFIRSIARGIPTATCMPGIFTNSHCTLECVRNPRMLSQLEHYYFDQEAAERMLCALHSSRIVSNSSLDDLMENVHIASWVVGLGRATASRY